MSLGEKLRQARLEAGLSQRALCGEEITRNMLSRIENGAAQPSMRTLQYLADQLGKPVSFFLEEQAVVSANQKVMESARRLYDLGQFDRAMAALEDYTAPDPVYDREKALLTILVQLALAEQAIQQHRERYARELLENTDTSGIYCAEALNRQRILLLGRLDGSGRLSRQLPSLDEELKLRAIEAIRQGDLRRGTHLLEAMQHRDTPQWMLLRGEAYLAENAYQNAVQCLRRAEDAFPEEVVPKLETCYRELGDYKQAYLYACKQKK
ncbi:MAG: helix-turn-helix domain-containing protein [Eubacteriales bacterium]|nr:helix-turn-helix domain-containing protein [Eubacteriales bacterium]